MAERKGREKQIVMLGALLNLNQAMPHLHTQLHLHLLYLPKTGVVTVLDSY